MAEVWLLSPRHRGAREPQPFPLAGLQRTHGREFPGPRKVSGVSCQGSGRGPTWRNFVRPEPDLGDDNGLVFSDFHWPNFW